MLGDAFVWRDTPQGYNYWLIESRKDNLSTEANKIMTEWLK